MRRLTIRMRLTVLYGGLFLLAGVVLLGVTYLLVEQRLDNRDLKTGLAIEVPKAKMLVESDALVKVGGGQPIPIEEAARLVNQRQAQFRQDTLNSLLTQGGVALVLVGVAACGFGWLMAERALRPVHEITATARRVAAGASAHRSLHERIALSGPRDEITELADTFDDMLERLDRSFDGQRRFVANASHELRTPLAINRALVEVAVTRPTASPDTRQLGDTLLVVNARHERLIDGLLMLADSETVVTDTARVDLRDVAAHVLEQCATGGLTVRRELGPAPTHGDPVLIERLVQNLVENAVRHNLPSGWLSVASATREGWAELTVANTGPVVAPYDIDTIFEPFRRLGGDRVRSERGFGLGLSIVRAVAHAHGGEVTAIPRDGGGLVVTVRLPRHPG
ncbi:MAG TPA: ATP-binding protein [Planosporangium sp.]|nr:ATP-binding protein [Planosporangium sp.]